MIAIIDPPTDEQLQDLAIAYVLGLAEDFYGPNPPIEGPGWDSYIIGCLMARHRELIGMPPLRLEDLQ